MFNMLKKRSSRKRKKQKILKNTEVISLIASTILSDGKPGQIIRPTPLAKAVTLSNGSNPHVNTVKAEFDRLRVAKEILKVADPMEEGYALRILEPYEKDIDFIEFKKEIRQKITKIDERLDKILILLKNLK